LIYVTSNRRHLLPEHESDYLGGKYVKGELQQSEAMEEKVSLRPLSSSPGTGLGVICWKSRRLDL